MAAIATMTMTVVTRVWSMMRSISSTVIVKIEFLMSATVTMVMSADTESEVAVISTMVVLLTVLSSVMRTILVTIGLAIFIVR